MYPFGVVTSDSLPEARDRLVAGLSDHGRVAVLGDLDADADRPAGAATEYRVDGSGNWVASGGGLDVAAALDHLAVDHEYAVLVGHPGADVPHVVVGDPAYDGEVLLAVEDVASLDPDAVRESIDATAAHESLQSLIEEVRNAPDADRAGAIATFTGRVRERDGPDDDPTTHLEFETYDEVARERMAALETELQAREGVHAVRMHHRTGVIERGEDIVFVVVLAGHRGEAFETVSDGIDRLKAEVPIFKKEVTIEEEFWLHER